MFYLKKNLKKKMLDIIKKPILLLIGKKSIIKTRLIEQLPINCHILIFNDDVMVMSMKKKNIFHMLREF